MANVQNSRDWIAGPSLSKKSLDLISFTLETPKTKIFGGLQCYDVPTRFVEVQEWSKLFWWSNTRVGTLIVAIIYLQLIQNRYMFRSFTVLQCSHQHCVQPVASDVEVVGYL